VKENRGRKLKTSSSKQEKAYKKRGRETSPILESGKNSLQTVLMRSEIECLRVCRFAGKESVREGARRKSENQKTYILGKKRPLGRRRAKKDLAKVGDFGTFRRN